MSMTLIEQISKWDEDWYGRFPKRITKKQKQAFLQAIETELHEREFETERIQVRNLLQNNLLATKCEEPKFIFLAHFDTPTIMPILFTAVFKLFGHTRQILGTIILLFLLYLPPFLPVSLFGNAQNFTVFQIAFQTIFILSLFTLFIPNPHNREDNTSGVIGLMALAEWLKDKPALKKHVQLIFLDNEEWGLLGSAGLKMRWDKQDYPYKNAKIINLDCISRGKKPLLVYHWNNTLAEQVLPYVKKHFANARTINMRWLPLSDNYTFRKLGALDISYADPSLIPGGYVISKIHTPRDKDFFPENLAPLITALSEFVEDEIGHTPA
ncbi:MAG: hypothetical protein DWQ04_29780 [Chloroflexi bacterium]|nr:MAG: hypothetical protein DWQ04_29780 [Chloroflexota bacterium]